jgi:hypothetical protein
MICFNKEDGLRYDLLLKRLPILILSREKSGDGSEYEIKVAFGIFEEAVKRILSILQIDFPSNFFRLTFYMAKYFKQAALLVFIFLSGYSVYAQNNFWSDRSDVRAGSTENQRKVFPLKFRSLTLDTAGLISFLKTTPKEFTEAARNNPVIVMLPMPDGSYNRFAVVETAIMDVSLAAQFPTIKTYGGQGIDDPYATVKIDWSPLGLHAMVRSPVHGSVLIDPSATDALTQYISYYKKDFTSVRRFIENGKLLNPEELHKSSRAQRTAAGQCIGTTLRTYRLAVACTGEYARAIGFGAAVTTAQPYRLL